MRILVKDMQGTADNLPSVVKKEISSFSFEKLDRFYRAAKVWFDMYEMSFSFEDR